MVPALLPPPAPFKLFVLMAGIAQVRPLQFVLESPLPGVLRYLVLGMLAIWYGDAALELMRTHGGEVALWLAGFIVLAAVLVVARRAPTPEQYVRAGPPGPAG